MVSDICPTKFQPRKKYGIVIIYQQYKYIKIFRVRTFLISDINEVVSVDICSMTNDKGN